jgi:hypothetical protein
VYYGFVIPKNKCFKKKLLLERFDKVVNETQKFKLIAALQQRQNKNSKDFLDRCKTAWYGLLRKLRTKYKEKMEMDMHDETGNECIKCMYICGLQNDIRMAVESIAGNTLTLETALTAAVQYESALVMDSGGGSQKQGGALWGRSSPGHGRGECCSASIFSNDCRNARDKG